MNKYVIINGCGGVGKDEFIKKCRLFNNNIVNMSTVEYVKKIALQCGWDGKKDDKGRRLLSDLKDALTRYNNIPVQHILESLCNYDNSIIFIHCREPDEIKFLKDKLKAKSLLITNANISLIKTNHADRCVFDTDYDYIVELLDLEYTASTGSEVYIDSIEHIETVKKQLSFLMDKIGR